MTKIGAQSKIADAAKTARSKLIAAVHVSAAKRGIDDDTRRDLMMAVVGKDSCTKMDLREIGRVLDAINKKPRGQRADGRDLVQAKAKALWISLYYLGIVRDGSDEALDAFVARQTNVKRLIWLTAPKAASVIEALKKMGTREANIDWGRKHGGVAQQTFAPQHLVCLAIWDQLEELGIMKAPGLFALDGYAKSLGITSHVFNRTDAEWNILIKNLGERLLKARQEKENG